MSMDVMVDLETAGTKAGCCILTIGACTFDSSYRFYEKIDINSCKQAGLTEDPATLSWWSKQDALTREEAFSGTQNLVMVLGKFSDWYRKLPEAEKTKFIWGNGADFDLPILEAAYTAVKMVKPWQPYNGRCYRTLKNLYRDVKMNTFSGMKHNALTDAVNQAAHAREILRIHFADE